MRPYRGKRVDNSEWVKGWLFKADDGRAAIITAVISDEGNVRPFDFVEVDPATVGQQTPHESKSGKPIYAGDIIKLSYGIPPKFDTLLIEYADDEVVADISVSGWWMRNIRPNGCSSSLCKTYEGDIEVIGNIHDEEASDE